MLEWEGLVVNINCSCFIYNMYLHCDWLLRFCINIDVIMMKFALSSFSLASRLHLTSSHLKMLVIALIWQKNSENFPQAIGLKRTNWRYAISFIFLVDCFDGYLCIFVSWVLMVYAWMLRVMVFWIWSHHVNNHSFYIFELPLGFSLFRGTNCFDFMLCIELNYVWEFLC